MDAGEGHQQRDAEGRAKEAEDVRAKGHHPWFSTVFSPLKPRAGARAGGR